MACTHSRLIRLPEVIRLTGLSKSTIYRLERKGLFPPRVKDGQHAVAWREREIIAWIEARPTVSRAYRIQ